MSHLTPHPDDSAPTPKPQISGANTLSLLVSLRTELIRPLLARYGLTTIDPNKWYDREQVLNVFAAMAVLPHITHEDFLAIGMKAIDTVPLPPEITDVESALAILPQAYQLNHQHIPADEGYTVRKISPTHYRFAANSPYPPYVIYGVVYGLMRRYSEGKNQFQVVLRTESPLVIEILW